MSWQNNRRKNLKKLIYAGILAALSFVLMRFTEFPIFPPPNNFLTIDLGDIPMLVGAIQLGPFYALAIALIKNLLFLASGGSQGGVIGVLVNFIAVGIFGLVTGFITIRKKNLVTVIIGLIAGFVTMAAVMIPTNLWAVPLFLPGITKAQLYTYIIKVNLPFNLIKGVIDTGITAVTIGALKGRKIFQNI